jgi:hypothetical protein
VAAGTSELANGLTSFFDGTNLFWRATDGSLITFTNPTLPAGPGFVELRVVSNIATVVIAGTTYATLDISSYGYTGVYTGFGSDHGHMVYYAEGGDTTGTGTAPAKVTGMTATSVTATRIDLVWAMATSNGQAITGYMIERAPDAAGAPGTWATLSATTGAPYPLSYSDTTVTAGQRWWYRVSAINSGGTGPASDPDDAIATAPSPPAFTENFSAGLKNWTVARWRSQGSQVNNPGYVPPSSNDDGHYDGVLGTHTTPTGIGLLPPYDIFVGSNNWLFVGGGSQNYGDTFLRCAQQMDLTGSGPWKIRLGFVPNPDGYGTDLGGLGLLGWSTLYATDAPQPSPSMTTDNSFGPVPKYGFAIRLDGVNVYDGSNYHPAPTSLTYNNYVETMTNSDGKHLLYSIPTTVPVEVEVTFTRSWMMITADGAVWATFSWSIPSALTSAWLYLGAHNHASLKYPPHPDSRSAIYTHFEFDGPVIQPQYSYAVADSLVPTSGAGEGIADPGNGVPVPAGMNIGWLSPTPTLVIPGVPANVSSAKLLLVVRWTSGFPDTGASYFVRYSLNGNATHDAQTDFKSGSGSFAYAIQVTTSELVTGDNTLNISLIGQVGGFAPYLGNISLLVESFSTGMIAVGSTLVQSLSIGNTAVQSLALGSTEIWRAPLPPRVPSAPSLITVLPSGVSGSGQLDARWSQPVDNGSALTDFTVQYRVSPAGTWTAFSHTAQTTRTIGITGLANTTAYDVRVAAVNGVGTGGWSNVLTMSTTGPPTVPSAPTLTTATPATASMGLAWTAPASGGTPITDYTIEYRTSPSGTYTAFSHTASTATTITVTGLTDGIAYDFRVSAVNAVGTGATSNVLTATPNTPVILFYLDDFNRGDGVLTTPWVTYDDTLSISNNRLPCSTSGGGRGAKYNQTFSADQWAEADVVIVVGATGNSIGPAVRMGSSGGGIYFFNYDAASQNADVYRRDAAANYAEAVANFSTSSKNGVFKARVEAQGTTIRLYIDNVFAGSGTDSTVASGLPGVFGQQYGVVPILDNFRCGNLPFPGWYADDFNRSDATLTTPWLVIDGTMMAITGNTIHGSGGLDVIRYDQTHPADQWAEADVSWVSNASTIVPICRINGTGSAANFYYLWQGAASQIAIVKRVGGTYTTIAGPVACPLSFKARIEAEGTTIRAYVNGVVTLTVTDSGVSTGYPGVLAAPGTGSTLDNFRSGGLPFPGVYGDRFNRANGAPGGNWNVFGGSPVINGNKLVPPAGGSDLNWATAMSSLDHWIEADVTLVGNSADYLVLHARCNAANVDGDCVMGFINPSSNSYVIGQNVGGSYSDINTAAGPGITGTFKLRLEVEGNNYRLYDNGVLKVSGTNTSHTTGSYVGFNNNSTSTTASFDNFRCGPLPYTP